MGITSSASSLGEVKSVLVNFFKTHVAKQTAEKNSARLSEVQGSTEVAEEVQPTIPSATVSAVDRKQPTDSVTSATSAPEVHTKVLRGNKENHAKNRNLFLCVVCVTDSVLNHMRLQMTVTIAFSVTSAQHGVTGVVFA